MKTNNYPLENNSQVSYFAVVMTSINPKNNCNFPTDNTGGEIFLPRRLSNILSVCLPFIHPFHIKQNVFFSFQVFFCQSFFLLLGILLQIILKSYLSDNWYSHSQELDHFWWECLCEDL